MPPPSPDTTIEHLPGPIEDDAVETIGGWVMRVAGRIPVQGEIISVDAYRITILAGERNHVSKVRIEVRKEESKHDTQEDK